LKIFQFWSDLVAYIAVLSNHNTAGQGGEAAGLLSSGRCMQGKAYVKKGGVSKDGKDSLIIDYRNTDNVFLRPMLDEMRRVGVLLSSHCF
jgi:hypothetical protein